MPKEKIGKDEYCIELEDRKQIFLEYNEIIDILKQINRKEVRYGHMNPSKITKIIHLEEVVRLT